MANTNTAIRVIKSINNKLKMPFFFLNKIINDPNAGPIIDASKTEIIVDLNLNTLINNCPIITNKTIIKANDSAWNTAVASLINLYLFLTDFLYFSSFVNNVINLDSCFGDTFSLVLALVINNNVLTSFNVFCDNTFNVIPHARTTINDTDAKAIIIIATLFTFLIASLNLPKS